MTDGGQLGSTLFVLQLNFVHAGQLNFVHAGQLNFVHDCQLNVVSHAGQLNLNVHGGQHNVFHACMLLKTSGWSL